MEYTIRQVNYEEIDKAFSLIWDTFLEFVAPDYSKEGIETFKTNYIESSTFKDCFKNGRQTMYGAYSGRKIIGVVSISIHNNISCIFVDKNYQRNGIATALINHIFFILRNKNIKKISLNASPYAVPFYHSVGFKDLDSQQNFHGISYTPMELIL